MKNKPINCEFSYQCPLDWDSLQDSENEKVKYCDVCNKNVYFAQNQSELNQFAAERKCIAYQPVSDERPLMGTPVYPRILTRMIFILLPFSILIGLLIIYWNW